jgi:hypothetical protein
MGKNLSSLENRLCSLNKLLTAIFLNSTEYRLAPRLFEIFTRYFQKGPVSCAFATRSASEITTNTLAPLWTADLTAAATHHFKTGTEVTGR